MIVVDGLMSGKAVVVMLGDKTVHMRLTAAQKRLKNYYQNPDKYYVEPPTRNRRNYVVVEVGKGIIDGFSIVMVQRAFERLIITHEERDRMEKL